MSNTNHSTKGVGLFTVLGIVLVVLKLCGLISMSWLWVLAPFWGQLVFVAIILIICFGIDVMGGKE